MATTFASIDARAPRPGRAVVEDPAARNILAAVVAGEPVRSATLDVHDPDALKALAEQEGVLPLVNERLARLPDARADLVRTFAAAATRHAAADVVRELELVRLVAGLAGAGQTPLIIKGAQLAYTHYRRPDLRPRMDTDLIVPPSGRAQAQQRMIQFGYEPVTQVTGDLVMYQAVYVKRRDGVPVHAVDLHWRLANPQRFGAVLTYEEMAASAVPIAGLGDRARGLSQTHALLVACIHPTAHHPRAQRLIWHYDVHLVASRLSAADWDAFTELAIDRRVTSICRRSLDLAQQQFGTAVPGNLLARFTTAVASDRATAAYLAPGRRQIHDAVWDLRALPTWSDRLRLVRQHLFPSAHYMRDVYAPASTSPLALLYARRALRGARRWLARS